MQSLLYVLNISTLATWLSVATFGTVGVIIPGWAEVFPMKAPELLETMGVSPEVTLGDAAPETEASATPATAEPLAPPPELPEMAELPPLPEVPDLPQLFRPAEMAPRIAAPPKIKQARRKSGNDKPMDKPMGKPVGEPAAKITGRLANAGMSDSARIAAGRMRSPSYPSFSRRNNQAGTVIVGFTVDAGGRVSSAQMVSSSGWPLLDTEAVQTVKSWKFPPGGVMKLQRPIVFRIK